jgi:hypothetical protein
MGLLSFFSRPVDTSMLVRLPTGSFTVDKTGRVLVSTLSSGFPDKLVNDIGTQVLDSFREATTAQLPLHELIIYFPTLKITARELRGGALIFLVPINLANSTGRIPRL